MRDHSLPFFPPMMMALLREIDQPGTGKTNTRRAIRFQAGPEGLPVSMLHIPGEERPRIAFGRVLTSLEAKYVPGDRIWVRERILKWKSGDHAYVRYAVDGKATFNPWPAHWKRDWSPPMFMPRELSRLTLIVTDVRVQRLQDISQEDALAEGVRRHTSWGGAVSYRVDGLKLPGHQSYRPRDAFSGLWDSLNADRNYGWDQNPWVYALTFTPIATNIDQLAA